MKAFLSHSSRDKPLVDQVAQLLGPANVELDSQTFDRGLLNVSAIQQALRRSSLFVLFLSQNSLSSNIVNYEALLAQELQARGVIDKFLVVCLDDQSFASADENWKAYNFVRKAISPQSIARLIQGALIAAHSKHISHPFVGRSKELHEAKERLIDPTTPSATAVYVSGNAGIGRRTFARRLYVDVFPEITPIFPEIHVEPLDGYNELFRKVYQVISPISTLSAFRTRIAAFAIDNDSGKASQIAQLIDSLIDAREALIILDHRGMLDDEGKLQEPLRRILSKVRRHQRPSIIFVAERMIRPALRNGLESAIFCPLPSLSRDEVRQLAALLLRQFQISYSNDDLEKIVEIADGHPYNVIFIVQAARQYTLPVFLADPSDFVQWKRRRASDFIQKITFSIEERVILCALRDFSALDFDTISLVVGENIDNVGRALARLIEMHIIETKADTYLVSPPIRVAVERDSRFSLPHSDYRKILEAVSSALKVHDESSTISLSLVNAGILAQLQQDGEVSELFSAFLLPSHHVWLARRRYDDGQHKDCVRFALMAIEGLDRLSPAGKIEACRLLCLAATRLGQEESFQKGIAILRSGSRDAFANSNINFLLGFNARLKGHLPEAEDCFRASYDDSPGNFSAARELASICMVRGDVESAEAFARQAFQVAQDNPYILDILLSILIKGGKKSSEQEISLLFEKLKHVGEEEGHSFYTTRRAEYEAKKGNWSEASKLIDGAAQKTPNIVSVRVLRAEIYLEQGNKTIAWDEIKRMQSLVYREGSTERRSNLRLLLQFEATYYVSTGKFAEAKDIYKQKGVFTETESQNAIRAIEIEQAFRNK
ncbi:MAG: TIR domain-containing protein [Xanthobacteraceae bacterium]